MNEGQGCRDGRHRRNGRVSDAAQVLLVQINHELLVSLQSG